MNAILYQDETSKLTKDALKYFKKAEKIIKKSQRNNENKNSNKKMIILCVIIVAFLIVFTFSTIFALINEKNNKIVNNISAMGIDISNLTIEEAKQKLQDNLKSRIQTDIVLKHNDEDYVLSPSQFDFSYDIDKTVEKAYEIGRDKNIFQNNYTILYQKKHKKNLNIDVSYNEDSLKNIVPQLNDGFKDGIKEPSYEINGNKLIVTAGIDGYVVKYEELKNLIISHMENEVYSDDSIEIPVETGKADGIDVESIHKDIYKEAVDASYSTNPYKITGSSTGLDFAISIDDAKKIITGNEKQYTIPLKIIYPKVTTDDIGQEAFPDLLASYTTSYATSNSNRSNNIALAASKLDGAVVMPGETFSYNSTIGQRTVAAGFKEAGAYSNGQVVTEVGGGICQVSSTLYNAVLRVNLEIVSRKNHNFKVGYVPIGTDATVSWKQPDFQFKNNRNYAIRIKAVTSNKKITIQIYGLKQDDDYEVEIQSQQTGTIAYTTTYTTDGSLRKGQSKVIQKGSNGATSITYKILKKNGEVVSKEVISRDKYQPHNQVIAKN